MGQKIQDIMSTGVQCVSRDTPLREVARIMRDEDIGDVLVTDSKGQLCGIVTDRDLVTRAVAMGCNVDSTTAGEVCSADLAKLPPTATVEEAVQLMRERAVRRVPVVSDGHAVGIVSIGDLAQQKDPKSALAEISAAPPTE